MLSYTIIKDGRKIFDGPQVNGMFADYIRAIRKSFRDEQDGPVEYNDCLVSGRAVDTRYEVYNDAGELEADFGNREEFARYLGISANTAKTLIDMMYRNPDMEDEQGRHYIYHEETLWEL